jgi:hypothetical protein
MCIHTCLHRHACAHMHANTSNPHICAYANALWCTFLPSNSSLNFQKSSRNQNALQPSRGTCLREVRCDVHSCRRIPLSTLKIKSPSRCVRYTTKMPEVYKIKSQSRCLRFTSSHTLLASVRLHSWDGSAYSLDSMLLPRLTFMGLFYIRANVKALVTGSITKLVAEFFQQRHAASDFRSSRSPLRYSIWNHIMRGTCGLPPHAHAHSRYLIHVSPSNDRESECVPHAHASCISPTTKPLSAWFND